MNWRDVMRTAAQEANLNPQVDRFWFLRHGLTDSNKLDINQGWLDTPLNAHGMAQVEAAAPHFMNHSISHIHASPLKRARVSAEIVARHLGHSHINFHDDLRERGVGEHEGTPAHGKSFWEIADGGAEPVDVFARRVVGALNTLLTQDAPLVVAHGGIRRVIFAALDIKDTHFGNAIPLMFVRSPGGWAVERLSENTGQDTFNPHSAV